MTHIREEEDWGERHRSENGGAVGAERYYS